jgi:hypothetical protein
MTFRGLELEERVLEKPLVLEQSQATLHDNVLED